MRATSLSTQSDFAKSVNGSSNYFVLISRREANELPYSVDEILKLVNTTSKTINGRKSDRRFYSVTKPLYDHTASMLYQDLNVGFEVPDAVVVEDSKSGYQFYDALLQPTRDPLLYRHRRSKSKADNSRMPRAKRSCHWRRRSIWSLHRKGARTARLQERSLVPPGII